MPPPAPRAPAQPPPAFPAAPSAFPAASSVFDGRSLATPMPFAGPAVTTATVVREGKPGARARGGGANAAFVITTKGASEAALESLSLKLVGTIEASQVWRKRFGCLQPHHFLK